MVYQSAGPEECADRWEVFRELPKPISWDEAERIAKEPQAPVQWKGVQANAVLDLHDLVARHYIPDYENHPRPFRTWNKAWRPQEIKRHEAGNLDLIAYQHTPLFDKDDIRVLELLPREGFHPLKFHFRLAHLDALSTDYEALSYAWGTKMVDCFQENRLITFPESLYRALLCLRRPKQARILWADALCIDQKNEREKSHQVRIMRHIYRKACKVLIWLGNDNAHLASPAFDLAHQIRTNQLELMPPPESPMWKAIILMFDVAWFGRLWCLQEVVLARSAEVIWGGRSAPWEDVGFTAGWICNVGYPVLTTWMSKTSDEHENSYHPGIYRASLMYSLWLSSKINAAQQMSFLDLLSLTRPFAATDPRDIVSALIGIPTTDADPDLGQCFFEPDYSRTLEGVFVEVAKKIIARRPMNMDILEAVQHEQYQTYGKPTYDIPSWVPDWSVFTSRSLMSIRVSGEQRVSASSKLPSFEATLDPALLVSGLQVDTVKTGIPLCSRASFSSLLECLSQAWKTLVQPLGIYPGGISLPEAFCWTILAGNNWYGRCVKNDERAQHIADCEAFRFKYCFGKRQYFPSIERLDNTAGDAYRFFEAICHACSNRQFFVTQKGYIGIGANAKINRAWKQEADLSWSSSSSDSSDKYFGESDSDDSLARPAIVSDCDNSDESVRKIATSINKKEEGSPKKDPILCAESSESELNSHQSTESSDSEVHSETELNEANDDLRVCVLSGAELPFILIPSCSKGRKLPGAICQSQEEQDSHKSFSVLGACYIHGIMDDIGNKSDFTGTELDLFRIV